MVLYSVEPMLTVVDSLDGGGRTAFNKPQRTTKTKPTQMKILSVFLDLSSDFLLIPYLTIRQKYSLYRQFPRRESQRHV